jgi:hypothetical protein
MLATNQEISVVEIELKSDSFCLFVAGFHGESMRKGRCWEIRQSLLCF